MSAEEHVGPLAEFQCLKQEIADRMGYQQHILSFQLTVAGGTLAFIAAHPSLQGLLLALPVVSYLLCGRLVAQYTGIRVIASYIQEELSPRVPGGLNWERWLREAPHEKRRFVEWKLPMLMFFPGVSVAATGSGVWLAISRSDSLGLGLVGFVVAVMLDVLVAGLTIQIMMAGMFSRAAYK